jgi:HK97 family phage major capsid protein
MALDLELKTELDAVRTALENKSAIDTKTAVDALEAKWNLATTAQKDAFTAELKTTSDAFQIKLDAIQAHADKLDLKLQEKGVSTEAFGYYENLTKSINDSFVDIKEVRKGNAIQLKVVGDMTLPVNLTGAQPKDYNFNVVMVPGQLINVSDLVGSVNIDGGTYTFPREGASEGAIGTQTEGSNKSQIDYDIAMIDVNTDFIAGYARYSKKMANNLPFLTSFIPKALRRDYFKSENANFYSVIAAAATDSPAIITGKNKVEMLIGDIAYQQGLNYQVNAIVVNPADFYSILVTEKSTGAGYGLPGIVTFEGGQLRINGIPLYVATWIPANKYLLGDWSRITKVNTQGLSLEFSEQEGTNFVKNNITARIESQTALAVEQPLAILLGDFTAIA